MLKRAALGIGLVTIVAADEVAEGSMMDTDAVPETPDTYALWGTVAAVVVAVLRM